MEDAIYADDLHVGARYQLGSHTVSEEELVDFARQWDPQIFHVDKEAADAGVYGGLIASGLHTLSIYQKLAVEGVFGSWNVIAGRSLREVRFLRPVRPGATLTGSFTITGIAFDDTKKRALVSSSAELVGEGGVVLTVDVDAYVHAR